jgi:hypothetical protein
MKSDVPNPITEISHFANITKADDNREKRKEKRTDKRKNRKKRL